LNQTKEFDGDTLVTHLRNEAEAYRKEKKRNTLSGVHQYLNMLNKKEMYACLTDSQGRVISFPPITNSDISKICEETTDIFVEVTSGLKLQTAKSVADELLKEMLLLDLGKKVGESSLARSLQVEQVKIVDVEGNLRVVYPSKTDLAFETTTAGKIFVKRP
jgi:phenylalanyl-tRNA synthetase beta subunit